MVLAGSLLLAACSTPIGRSAGDLDPADLQRPQPTGTTDGTATDRHRRGPEVIEAAPKPNGFRTLTAARSKIQLAAPAEWLLVSADAAADAGASALSDYAEAMGVPLDQLTMMMKQVEVMAVGPTGDSVNVIPTGVLAELPSPSALRAQFETFGAEMSRIRDVEVPAGPGRLAYYKLSVPGQPVRYAASLLVRGPAGIANITVATSSRSGTRRFVDEILPTVEPLGSAGQA